MKKNQKKLFPSIVGVIALAAVTIIPLQYLNKTNFDIRQQADVVTVKPVGIAGNWNLLFNDEFEGTQLDTTKWSTCYYYACTGWWHLERQWYQPQNVVVSNGVVKLIAKKETIRPGDGNTYEFSSGMIQSGQVKQITEQPKFKFQHGYLEGRIKVPEGKGYWPAFWTTGSYDHPPELDLFEYFSNTNELSQGFWYLENGQKKSWNGGSNLKGQNFANEWHTYGVDWDPNYIAFYFNGNLVKKYEGPIMKQLEVSKEQHLILNFAVGATFLPAPDATTPTEAAMEVDYVRVWKRDPGTQPTPVSSVLPSIVPFPTTQPPSPVPTKPPTLVPSPTPSVNPTSTICSGDGIYLYTNDNYQGTCAKFTANVAEMRNTSVGSDSVSSLKVVGPYQVIAFSDGNYKGVSSTFTVSRPSLSDSAVKNDSISSVQVSQTVPVVTTPTDPNQLQIAEILLINEKDNSVIKSYKGIEMSAITIDRSQYASTTLVAVPNKAAGSIKFNYGSTTHIENGKPYAIAGDLFGDYGPWNPGTGTFTVLTTPFSQANAKGTGGKFLQTTVIIK